MNEYDGQTKDMDLNMDTYGYQKYHWIQTGDTVHLIPHSLYL